MSQKLQSLKVIGFNVFISYSHIVMPGKNLYKASDNSVLSAVNPWTASTQITHYYAEKFIHQTIYSCHLLCSYMVWEALYFYLKYINMGFKAVRIIHTVEKDAA